MNFATITTAKLPLTRCHPRGTVW